MLWPAAFVVLVIWAIAMMSSFSMGGAIHLLLVAAVVLVVVQIFRSPAPI